MKSGSSIIDQVRLLKNKLNQQATTIVELKKKLTTQSKAFRQSMAEMQQHESRILLRLRKLQQINLKYIRDYMQIKQQAQVQNFHPIISKFQDGIESFVERKYKQTKQETEHLPDVIGSKNLVSKCYSLMKEYLNQHQVNYQIELQKAIENSRNKMKECKSIEGFKQNKEEARFVEQLKAKIELFNKGNKDSDQSKVMNQFYLRCEIEQGIARLKKDEGMISLQESLNEQKLFESIIEEVMMAQIESNQIAGQFIEQSFSYLEERLQHLTSKYGQQFADRKVEQIKGRMGGAKEDVHVERLYSQQDDKLNTLIQIQHESSNNFGSSQFNSNTYQPSKINVLGSTLLKTNAVEYSQLVTTNQGNAVVFSRQRPIISKSNANDRLSSAVQSSMTKSFFQQQQRSRDQLINHQNKQIEQHEQVIDKLITFIKKEFKERKMQDIEGDDPQKLMSYYFKVNEKKYVDIKQQMQELKGEATKKTKQIDKLNDQINTFTDQNQNLRLKLELQKLQIQALSQIYEKIRASTIQCHILICKTEDLVKLSLETLFNLCMNKTAPNLMIQQLERIIELIKVNMAIKKNIMNDLTIYQYIEIQQKQVKKKFSTKAREDTRKIRSENRIQTHNKYNPSRYIQMCIQPAQEIIIRTQKEILSPSPQKTYFKKGSQKHLMIQQLKPKKQRLLQMPRINKFALDFDLITSGILEASLQQLQEVDCSIIIPKRLQNSERIQGQPTIPQMQTPSASREYVSEFEKVPKKQNSSGFDENFIKIICDRIEQIKESKLERAVEIEEMYAKYKQALSCLQRSEKLNKQNEMKFQNFLISLKEKGAWQSAGGLEEKLFYMQRVITTQNQLLQNQRKEYEDTILKQVKQSQDLAQDVLRDIRKKHKKLQR